MRLVHEGAGAGGRVENLHVVVGQAAPEVLLQQVVGAPDDEVHHLVGSVDHAQAVGGGGVVGLVKVFVDGLEEPLLFGPLRDFVGGPSDGGVIGLQVRKGLKVRFVGEESRLKGAQPAGDIVCAVQAELRLVDHPLEDVLREDVLQEHFAHIVAGHRRADAPLADREEVGGGGPVVGIARLGRLHGLPQAADYGRKIRLELLLGLAEFRDLRRLIVKKAEYESVQFLAVGHIHPQGFLGCLAPLPLEKDGSAGILKDDIFEAVAGVEFLLNLGVQVVVGVLGLPVAAWQAQGIDHGAVGPRAAAGGPLGYEREIPPAFPAVGIEVVLEGAADVLLVVRAAEVNQALLFLVVTLNVGVGGHGANISQRRETPGLNERL